MTNQLYRIVKKDVDHGLLYGAINRNGEIVIPTKYHHLFLLSSDFAFVEEPYYLTNRVCGFLHLNDGGDLTVIPESMEILDTFGEGMIGAYNNLTRRFCFLKKSGDLLYELDSDWEIVSGFRDGYALIVNRLGDYDQYRYVDSFGNSIGPESIVHASPFSNGTAIIKTEKDYCFLDASGEVWHPDNCVIDPSYTVFSEGYAAVKIPSEEQFTPSVYGLINKKGKRISEKLFSSIAPFSSGKGIVSNQSNLFGVINYECEYIVQPEFDRIEDFEGNYAPCKKEGEWMLLTEEGVSPFINSFSFVGSFKEGIALAIHNGKEVYIDLQGNIIKHYEC